jgi:hypothetical protein
MYIGKITPELSERIDFTVTIAAVNRPVATRLERNLGFLAALSAYCGVHLVSGTVAIATVPVRLPCPAAVGTALRLIDEAFGLEKFLFVSAESESNSAIGALKRLILKAHWMTSSSLF